MGLALPRRGVRRSACPPPARHCLCLIKQGTSPLVETFQGHAQAFFKAGLSLFNVASDAPTHGLLGCLGSFHNLNHPIEHRPRAFEELTDKGALTVAGQLGELAKLSGESGLQRDGEAWVFAGMGAS